MDVTLLHFDGCPHWRVAESRLSALADELDFTVTRQQVTSPEEAEEVGFRGSPTIMVDGRNAFAEGDEPVGMVAVC